MKVLIVGSGGREHAIAYCVAKSEKVDKIAPRVTPVLQNMHSALPLEQWNLTKL